MCGASDMDRKANGGRTRQFGPIHASISKQITPMYGTIKERFEGVADDLRGMNAYRYQSNISGGVQEYMEAVLFHHYLETQRLLTHPEAESKMPGGVMLTEEDYLLGVFDMTGELMRFSVTYMATNGKLPGGEEASESMLTQMQAMRSSLESMNVAGHQDLKGFGSKLQVTRQSLGKIENSAYGMMVRGQERPKGWMPDEGQGGRGSPVPESY
jgi:predicted translin family RNA/ssDNA-binding protein